MSDTTTNTSNFTHLNSTSYPFTISKKQQQDQTNTVHSILHNNDLTLLYNMCIVNGYSTQYMKYKLYQLLHNNKQYKQSYISPTQQHLHNHSNIAESTAQSQFDPYDNDNNDEYDAMRMTLDVQGGILASGASGSIHGSNNDNNNNTDNNDIMNGHINDDDIEYIHEQLMGDFDNNDFDDDMNDEYDDTELGITYDGYDDFTDDNDHDDELIYDSDNIDDDIQSNNLNENLDNDHGENQ